MKPICLKILIALLAIVPVSTFAQGIPADVPPEVVLAHVLELSEEQVAEIQQLVDEREASIEPWAFEIHALHEELAAILESETPDPHQIGEIVVVVHELQEAIESLQEDFREAFLSLLSPEQRDRVEHIHGVAIALRAAQALEQIGLR